MLQTIRDKAHGWWTWVLVPVLIIVFALFGIQNYLGGSFSQNEAARVNGQSISTAEFSVLYQNASQAKNPTQNAQVAQSLKIQVLQTLVQKLILSQGLQKLGMIVGDAAINQMIYQIPAFQENGQFSMALYENFLQSIGETTEDLKTDLRGTFLINQFQNGLLASQFGLPNEVQTENNYSNMLRDISYIPVSLNDFKSKTAPSDAEIQNYYTANQNNFMTAAQVKLSYVTLSLSQFSNGTDPNTAQANYSAALNKAANLAFQNAGSLDSVAQAFKVPLQNTAMIDTGHPTGILSNKDVLQAALSASVLSQGNNSNVIPLSSTQAVIIRVTDSVPAQPQPLSQVKAQVVSQIQNQAAMQAANQALSSIVTSINQGGNIKELAQSYGLSVKTASKVGAGDKSLPAAIGQTVAGLGTGQSTAVAVSPTSYVIVAVNKVYPNPQSAGNTSINTQAIAGLWTQIEISQFVAGLQDQAKVKINQALFKQN